MSKKANGSGTVQVATEGRWIQPPGLRGAWYAPESAAEIRDHVLGAEDKALAYREAVLMHELHEKLDATFVLEEPPFGPFPFRDDLEQP